MRNTIWIASAGQIASVFAQRIGVAVMAFVILTSFAIAYAEDPDGNPHQRSTDFRRAPGIQLCRALYIQSVRKKVGLSEEDFVLLRKSIGFLSTSFPTVEEFSKGSSQDREVLLETIAREAEKLEPEVWSMVSRMIGREGIDILMGLYIKYHGYGAILNERIADRMRLSSEQRTKIVAAIDNLRVERGLILPNIASGEGIDKVKINELLILRGSANDFVVRSILTKDQIDFIESGDQFEVNTSGGLPFARFTFGW